MFFINALLTAACIWCLYCKAEDCFEGYCYFVGEAMTWTDSVLFCEEMDAVLTSIHSDEENQYINNLCGGDCWFGLNRIGDSNSWQWVDGTPFDYSNWADGQPDNYSTGEDFGEFFLGEEFWNDLDGNNLRTPVCKYVAYGFWGTNGARYHDEDTGEVFLYYERECHHIPNPTTFNKLFKNWNMEPLEPTTIGHQVMECPKVYDIDPNAMLVKFTNSDRVYFLNGELRWIADPETFERCNFDSNKIVEFESKWQPFFREGPELKF